MEYLAELILSGGRLNGAIVGGIFGAISALLGWLIGTFLSKIFKKAGLVKWVTIIFTVCSFQIPNLIKPYLKETYGTTLQDRKIEILIQELEKHRLFATIFKYHPEARHTMSEKMKDIIYNKKVNGSEVRFLSQQASTEIVNEYVLKHMLAVSDEQLNALLRRNYEVLTRFKDKPALCVGYHLGQPNFSPSDITQEFIEQEGNMKADIIVSAINNPSIPPRAGNIDEVLKIIAEGYQQKGYSLDNLAKVDIIKSLNPSEGCKVAIEFADVLDSLEAKTSSFVFKNLMYMGSLEPQN